MKRLTITGIATAAIISIAAGCTSDTDSRFADKALDYCVSQVRTALTHLPDDPMRSPRNIAPGDSVWACQGVSKGLWTEGFWPGVLWYAYEASGDEAIRAAAVRYTEVLDFIAHRPAYDHDIGFIMFPSYGNGYRLTGNEQYKEDLLLTAGHMTELFNPAVGTILSWPREVENFGGHNTIMDNMLNLETLLWGAANGGDPAWSGIAAMHADTTMAYNFRPDGTSYHVAVYDPVTGEHKYSCTHQGYSDDSMWARGQAWGIYGYTMCYRFLKDARYLDFARKIAGVFLERLPEDMVPYWDFNDPAIPNAPRDASAAAIVASALIELDGYVPGEGYMDAAVKMLRSLYDNYRAEGVNDAFLLHSTGHCPKGSEVDYSIVYADYYFIEALLRLKTALK